MTLTVVLTVHSRKDQESLPLARTSHPVCVCVGGEGYQIAHNNKSPTIIYIDDINSSINSTFT